MYSKRLSLALADHSVEEDDDDDDDDTMNEKLSSSWFCKRDCSSAGGKNILNKRTSRSFDFDCACEYKMEKMESPVRRS